MNLDHNIFNLLLKVNKAFFATFAVSLGILSVIATKVPYPILVALCLGSLLLSVVVYFYFRWRNVPIIYKGITHKITNHEALYWSNTIAVAVALLVVAIASHSDLSPAEKQEKREKARTLIYNEVYLTGGVGQIAEQEIRESYADKANITIKIQGINRNGISQILAYYRDFVKLNLQHETYRHQIIKFQMTKNGDKAFALTLTEKRKSSGQAWGSKYYQVWELTESLNDYGWRIFKFHGGLLEGQAIKEHKDSIRDADLED